MRSKRGARTEDLEAELRAAEAEFVQRLEAAATEYAREISRFRQSVNHLASDPDAFRILSQRSDGNRGSSRAALLEIIENRNASGGTKGQYIADLRALAIIAEQDLGIGEATTQDVIDRYRAVVDVNPSSSSDWLKLSAFESEQGNFQQSIAAAERAAELSSNSRDKAVANISIAQAYIDAGDYLSAKNAMSNAVDAREVLADENDIGSLYNLGDSLTMMAQLSLGGATGLNMNLQAAGDYGSAAAAVYRSIIELDANQYVARRKLAMVLMQIKMRELGHGVTTPVDTDEILEAHRQLIIAFPESEQLLAEAYQTFDQLIDVSSEGSGLIGQIMGSTAAGSSLSARQKKLLEEQLAIVQRLRIEYPKSPLYELWDLEVNERLNPPDSHIDHLALMRMSEDEREQWRQKEYEKAIAEAQSRASLMPDMSTAQGREAFAKSQKIDQEIRELKQPFEQAMANLMMGTAEGSAVLQKMNAAKDLAAARYLENGDWRFGFAEVEIMESILSVKFLLGTPIGIGYGAIEEKLEELNQEHPNVRKVSNKLEEVKRTHLQFRAYGMSD